MTSTLVMLTRNEIEGIRALFDKIPLSAFDEVLVIDGQSKDGTIEFFQQRSVPVIVQQQVLGRGEAFRLAAEKAKGDILVFFSPDGNEDPADILRLRDQVQAGCDLAIASRFLPGSRNEEDGQLLPLRAWANQAFGLAASLAFRGRITDVLNGFRAIRKERFCELRPDATGFAIEFQLSCRALKRRFKIVEIPTYEGDRIGGHSTASSIPTGLLVLKVLLREIWIGDRF
jgi:glycosyltransferase involved in cell wall biosynthesis